MTRLIAIIAYWTGLDALFYWLNRKRKRIITFHNILPKELWRGGVANGVSTKLENFVKIVEMVRARFEITNDLFKSGTCTITFDDGYRSQYEYGYKTLKQMGVPAYFFISGDLMNGGEALVIDKLTHWVDAAPEDVIPAGDRAGYWECVLWKQFLGDNAQRGRSLLRVLEAKCSYSKVLSSFSKEYIKMRLEGMSAEELQEIMSDADYCVGWHTKSHYPLARLSLDEVRAEMVPPTGMETNCFSFPYGERESVDIGAIDVAKGLGYPCAVSNMVSPGIKSNWFLPRMSLSSDKYLLHFELSGLKIFLSKVRALKQNKVIRVLKKIARLRKRRACYYLRGEHFEPYTDSSFVRISSWSEFRDCACACGEGLFQWQKERFDRGDRFLAIIEDGKLLCSGWESDNYRKLVGCYDKVGIRILYDFETPPEYRGKGFYTRILKHLISEGDGLIYARPENLPSVRTILKVGFVKYAEGVLVNA